MDWFQAEGFTDEAVRHLIAAGDVAGGAELVAASWGREYNRGGLSTVSAWLDLLPETTVTGDPRLCLIRAWIALDTRWLPDAQRWIEAADAGLAARRAAHPAGTDGHDTLDAEISVLHAVHLFKIGNVAHAVSAARHAISLDLGEVPLGQSAANCVYGAALYWAGRVPDARAAFGRAVQLSDEVKNYLGRTYSIGYLALISAERGQLGDADQLTHRAAAGDRDDTAGEHFVDMMPALATAKVLGQRGETAQACDAAQRALMLSQRGGEIWKSPMPCWCTRKHSGSWASGNPPRPASQKLAHCCRTARTQASPASCSPRRRATSPTEQPATRTRTPPHPRSSSNSAAKSWNYCGCCPHHCHAVRSAPACSSRSTQ